LIYLGQDNYFAHDMTRFGGDESEIGRMLERAFVAAKWSVEVPEEGADLIARRGDLRYAIEVKAAAQPKRSQLEAMLAAAVLESRAYARDADARPLAIVRAPHVSDKMAAVLRDYMARFAKGIAWGCLDDRGRFELHGPGLEIIEPPKTAVHQLRVPAKAAPHARADLFSDLGQWLLKVLLAPRFAEKLLHVPRVDVRNAKHLAEVAGVSIPHAARQVRLLRERGFLPAGRELQLIRVTELFDLWKTASARPTMEVPAQWVLPVADSSAELRRVLAKRADVAEPRAALGLFEALSALKLKIVHGAPRHLYVERLSRVPLEELGLVQVDPGERVDVFIREPRFVETVFRGAVSEKGVAACDVIQCWLDVSQHPVRGDEQAAEIWKKVIDPALRSGAAAKVAR
jgi:hypothetical protein